MRTSINSKAIQVLIAFTVLGAFADRSFGALDAVRGDVQVGVQAGIEEGTFPLRRLARTWLFGPTAVWTDGTVNGVFRPLSEPMESAGIINVRVALELSDDSGDCEMQAAVQYSDDGVGWSGNTKTIGNAQNGNGTLVATTYTDITSGITPRSYLRFGVNVWNGTAGAIQLCNVLPVTPAA